MKNKNLSFALGAVLTAGALIASSTARAEELPQTKAQQQFSVTQGFKQTALTVLNRTGSVDPKQAGARLIEKLRPGSPYQNTMLNTKLHLTGNQWTLDVTADGSGAEYQDKAVEARAHSLRKPVPEKMSAEELEQKGRAYI